MKKYILLLAISVVGFTKGFSQYYYNPYCTYNYEIYAQVFFEPCVQATIRSAQIANQIDQQIYQYQMNLIQNGFYNQNQNTYSTFNSNNLEQMTRTTYVTCDNCKGKGYNTRDIWMGGGEIRTLKQRCAFCHGTGKVRQ